MAPAPLDKKGTSGLTAGDDRIKVKHQVKEMKTQLDNEINNIISFPPENKHSAKHTQASSWSKCPKPAVLRTETHTYSSPNLSRGESEGLKSLTQRVKNKEITIATSDKSNRFVVLKNGQYLESGLKHTEGDRVITQDDVKRIQNILNAHTSWFTKIFNTGSHWGHEARMEKKHYREWRTNLPNGVPCQGPQRVVLLP